MYKKTTLVIPNIQTSVELEYTMDKYSQNNDL